MTKKVQNVLKQSRKRMPGQQLIVLLMRFLFLDVYKMYWYHNKHKCFFFNSNGVSLCTCIMCVCVFSGENKASFSFAKERRGFLWFILEKGLLNMACRGQDYLIGVYLSLWQKLDSTYLHSVHIYVIYNIIIYNAWIKALSRWYPQLKNSKATLTWANLFTCKVVCVKLVSVRKPVLQVD